MAGNVQERRRRGGVGATAGTTLNCMIWPVVSRVGRIKINTRHAAAERFVRPDVAEDIVPHRHVGEVDDNVGTLGKPEQELIAVSR